MPQLQDSKKTLLSVRSIQNAGSTKSKSPCCDRITYLTEHYRSTRDISQRWRGFVSREAPDQYLKRRNMKITQLIELTSASNTVVTTIEVLGFTVPDISTVPPARRRRDSALTPPVIRNSPQICPKRHP
jgi:hypothetical protein